MLTFIISTLNLFISKELVNNYLTSTFVFRKQTAHILKQPLCVEKKEKVCYFDNKCILYNFGKHWRQNNKLSINSTDTDLKLAASG